MTMAAKIATTMITATKLKPPPPPEPPQPPGPPELQRLRTLRELLERFHCGLSDVAFAKRMRAHADLRDSVERWLEEPALRPEHVPAADWLGWEQEKHERLLNAPVLNHDRP